MPLTRHILVTISESLYTVYIQQLERGDVLPHDMVESSAAAWRDEMSRKVAGK